MPFSNPKETGRPITIKDEGVTVADNIESIDFVGGGVAGGNVGADNTETLPGGGVTYTPETPSGTIHGSNTAFTITSSSLLALFLNGVYQTGGGVDYTLSGTDITYVNAPPAGSGHKAIIYT